MAYKIIRKDPIYKNDFSKPAQVAVYITQDDPHTQIVRTISGDFFDKSDDDIIAETLEQFYQETYLNRAENEKIAELQNINKEQAKQLKDSLEMLESTRKALAENTLLAYDNQEEIESITHKIEYLLNHLNITIPEEKEGNDEENKEESTENTRESTNI